MNEFQWRVALCDDNPRDNSIVQTQSVLEQANFSVLLVSTRDDFIRFAGELARCHLALIDMDWGGVFSDDKDVESIPRLNEFDPSRPEYFVKQWVSSIASWGCATAPESVEWREWPRCRIDAREMGAWLGALLASIAPGIEIIFYSGKPGVASSGFAAALGRFRDAAYTVETKSDRASLSLPSVTGRLRKLQEEALQRSDIYDWFLADVLLPKLLGAPVVVRNLPEPAIHQARPDVRSFNFNADKFFPALANTTAPNSLHDFYRQTGSRLVEPAGMSLLEHDVRKLNFAEGWFDDCDALIAELNQIAQLVLACAPSAVGIARKLWDAVDSIRVQDENSEKACREIISRAWQLSWATLFEPSCEFQRLATQFSGSFMAQSGSETTYPSDYREATKRSERLEKLKDRTLARIDLEGLERACVHLKANGSGTLQIIETNEVVAITWSGDWDGSQPSFEEFKQIVMESLQKPLGAHRGLPSVILFGLVNGAQSMRVQLGQEWHLLFGDPAGNPDVSDQFRFEWTFAKE